MHPLPGPPACGSICLCVHAVKAALEDSEIKTCGAKVKDWLLDSPLSSPDKFVHWFGRFQLQGPLMGRYRDCIEYSRRDD